MTNVEQYYVSPVSQIVHREHRIDIPTGTLENGGKVTAQLKEWLAEIMYGSVEHEWATVVAEKNDQ